MGMFLFSEAATWITGQIFVSPLDNPMREQLGRVRCARRSERGSSQDLPS